MVTRETFRAIRNMYAALKELDDQGVLESHGDMKYVPQEEMDELLKLIQEARDELFKDACMGNLQN